MVLICKSCFARWHKVGDDDKDECPICKNKSFKEANSMSEARRVTAQMRHKKNAKKGVSH